MSISPSLLLSLARPLLVCCYKYKYSITQYIFTVLLFLLRLSVHSFVCCVVFLVTFVIWYPTHLHDIMSVLWFECSGLSWLWSTLNLSSKEEKSSLKLKYVFITNHCSQKHQTTHRRNKQDKTNIYFDLPWC